MSTDNLTRRTLGGVSWLYLQTVVSALMQIGMAGVMARLLDPAAFGLVALGSLSLRFVNYFARGGITKALIHKRGLDDDDVRAGFTLSTGLGLAGTALVWVLAPLAETLFGDPDVVPVVRWMAAILLFAGVGATSSSLLQREMRFRVLALREITSYIIGYVGVGLVLALRGAGVWALVAAMVTKAAVSALLSFLARPHPVRPILRREPYRQILSFGSRVSLISFLEFLGTQTDTFAVGRWAGATTLGLYNRANLLADLPAQYLGTSLSKVLFPAFSGLQDELDRLRSVYFSAVRVVAAGLLPMAAGIMVAAPEIVLVILGPDWAGAVPILPWLAATAGVSVVNHFGAVVAEAQAALNAKLVIAASKVVVLVGLLMLASGRTPAWYALALFGATVYAHACYVVLLRRTLSSDWPTMLGVYARPLVSAAVTAAAIAGVRLGLLAAGSPLPAVLVGEIVTGGAVLAVLAAVGPLRPVREEIADRLALAGITPAAAAPLGLTARLIGVPRPVPDATVGRATSRPEPEVVRSQHRSDGPGTGGPT